jgi:predicted AlkP superfamily pyrophosphatase or phosphodiesterase
LNQANLEPYFAKIKNFHPRGLKWILGHRQSRHAVNIGYPSITAASHISTMTCARPGQHGVFLNNGNWDGEKNLSGFAMPYKTQTWVQALRRDRKKVAVAAYPSVDGSSPERSADMGIAYDTPQGKTQYVVLSATNQSQMVEVPSRADPSKTFKFKLTLNADGRVDSVEGGRTVSLPVGKAVDNFLRDGEGSTQRSASVSMMNLGVQDQGVVVAVSPLSISPIVGANLLRALDQKNVVWSNLKDYGFANYKNGLSFALEALRHRRAVEMAAIKEMLATNSTDALFMYFEDIDSILHGWIGENQNIDEIAAYIQEFDKQLGEFIQSLPMGIDMVVMGDHGMSSINYELNVRELLPKDTAQHFQIRTSGGTAVFYPAGRLDSGVPAQLDLNAVVQTLRDVRVEFDGNKKVFGRVFLRDSDEARSLGLSGPNSPWVMAFANEGIALTDKIDQGVLVARRASFIVPEKLRDKYPDPMNSGVLVQPRPFGAHGHDSVLASMKTALTLIGPKLQKINMGEIRDSTDVVPAVADALGWARPASCL